MFLSTITVTCILFYTLSLWANQADDKLVFTFLISARQFALTFMQSFAQGDNLDKTSKNFYGKKKIRTIFEDVGC